MLANHGRRPFVAAAKGSSPWFYTPTFSKHLWALAASDFYARELDADDHEFLERVRVRGIANGDLPYTNAFCIDELEFWHLPYSLAPTVERAMGPVARRTPEEPWQAESRRLRLNAWHARRALRKQERELAAAELERERIAWKHANETRKLREALSDAEWDAAAPKAKKLRYGKIENRHFVPQWKLDERGELNEVDEKIAAKEARARRKREAIERENERQRVLAEERMAREALDRAAREKAEFETTMLGRYRERQRELAEQQERMMQAERELRELAASAPPPPNKAELKRKIVTLVIGSAPKGWTRTDMARVFGVDADWLGGVLAEMVRDGELRCLQWEPRR